jgi:hypothetical protein
LYIWNRRHGIENPVPYEGAFAARLTPIQHKMADWELWDCTPTLREFRQARELVASTIELRGRS